MSGTVAIRVTRPALLQGRAVPAGQVVKLSPAEACAALDSGRGELVCDDDAAVLLASRREEQARAVRKAAQPPAGWPWQPLR